MYTYLFVVPCVDSIVKCHIYELVVLDEVFEINAFIIQFGPAPFLFFQLFYHVKISSYDPKWMSSFRVDKG